jgi:hypothetical protein
MGNPFLFVRHVPRIYIMSVVVIVVLLPVARGWFGCCQNVDVHDSAGTGYKLYFHVGVEL